MWLLSGALGVILCNLRLFTPIYVYLRQSTSIYVAVDVAVDVAVAVAVAVVSRRVVSRRVAVVAFPKIKIRVRGASLNSACTEIKIRARGANLNFVARPGHNCTRGANLRAILSNLLYIYIYTYVFHMRLPPWMFEMLCSRSMFDNEEAETSASLLS